MDIPNITEDPPSSSSSNDVVFDAIALEEDETRNEASGVHLSTSDENSFRSRSNSEVQYDIIPISPRAMQDDLPEFIRDHEHDRGIYYLPDVAPEIQRSDEYPKLTKEPAEIFVFNFETFPKSPPREGTRLDVRALIDTFGRLKINLPKERILNNLTKNNLLTTIKTAITIFNSQPRKPNCLIVFFLTHGLANNVIEVKDDKMTVEEIIHEFTDCKALEDVPKWFTFLACKENEKADHRVNKPNTLVSNQTYIKRLPDDVILYYSTTEDNRSARRKEEGSWLIQELCKSLQAYGRRDEVFDILTRTNKCIANNYQARDNEKCFRQCPVILSTLTRKFYLTLSKDRVAHLKMLKTIEDIQNLI